MKGHLVYVLLCADGSLYTGYTVDLARRLAAHQAGKGAKYTRARLPVRLCAVWAHESKKVAMREEASFKRLKRAAKLRLLADSDGGTRPFSP